MNVSKRKSVVFLISDFIDRNYWNSLKLVNKKHDLIGIRIFDPAELNIPNIGLLKAMTLKLKMSSGLTPHRKKNENC